MHVRRWAAAAGCVLLLALGACSNDTSQAQPQDPTTSAAPSPSPSETDEGPSIPPEAMGTDEASAKAFVRFYFDRLSDAARSGSTGQLVALAKPACKTCAAFSELIDDVYSKGGSYETKGWDVERVIGGRGLPAGTPSYVLRIREHERRLLDSDGKVVDSHEMTLVPMQIRLVRDRDAWSVARLDVIS